MTDKLNNILIASQKLIDKRNELIFAKQEIDKQLNQIDEYERSVVLSLLKEAIDVYSISKEELGYHFKSNLSENNKNNKKRVAICLRGAMSKLKGGLQSKDEFYEKNNIIDYCNYNATYKCFYNHIILPNSQNYDIDIFFQSWNPDLKDELLKLYKPVAYSFEDNRQYFSEFIEKLGSLPDNFFSQISQGLAIKKTLLLKEQYEKENNVNYDLVLIYRPDLVLVKNIYFDLYDLNRGVFCNQAYITPEAPEDGQGEFYWIMSNENAYKFKYLYETNYYLQFVPHRGIRNFVHDIMGENIYGDHIRHGQDILPARTEIIGTGALHLIKYGFDF